MEEGCIFEVMPPMKGGGKQKKKKKKKKKKKEEEKHLGGDGLAEKEGKESGWNENSGEKMFEVDMRQIKENMGDCINIVVKISVPLPKEDRRKSCCNANR